LGIVIERKDRGNKFNEKDRKGAIDEELVVGMIVRI